MSDWISAGLGLLDTGLEFGQMALQNKYTKDAELRQEQRQIEAEKRANAEYDRRMADERAYNDPTAQAERLRAAGINPMANLGQGVSSSSTKMSSPTQSTPSMGSAPSANGLSSLGTTFLENQAIQADIAKTNQEGEKLFIENSWERFVAGDRGNPVHQPSQDFTIRYSASIDEKGEIILNTLPPGQHHKIEVDCEKYVYKSKQYGDFSIYENGWAVSKLKEEYTSLVGDNAELAERLAQSWCNLYFHAVEAMSSGKQADAAKLKATADIMAAQYNFGDEVSGKWILQQVFNLVGAGVDVYNAGKNVAKLPKK